MEARVMTSNHDIAILGAGMHPWGKWGRNFIEYGIDAAQAALVDAGVGWRDIQFVAGADTMRNGYPGYVSAATFAQALGWSGAQVASSYAACASGATALATARAQILAGLCDVALVVGADTTPKGFLAPNAGDRPDDPDWLRFRLLGATNPSYFALYARRHGAGSPVRVRGISTVADIPEHRHRDAELRERFVSGVGSTGAHLPRLDHGGRLRRVGCRSRRPLRRRGLRPVVGARARLVREHRSVQGRGGRAPHQRRRHRPRRQRGHREPEWRTGVLRRGRARPGHRAGVGGHLATARAGRGRTGRGPHRGWDRQPGPVRPWLS